MENVSLDWLFKSASPRWEMCSIWENWHGGSAVAVLFFGLKLLKIHKLGANLLGWDTFEHSTVSSFPLRITAADRKRWACHGLSSKNVPPNPKVWNLIFPKNCHQNCGSPSYPPSHFESSRRSCWACGATDDTVKCAQTTSQLDQSPRKTSEKGRFPLSLLENKPVSYFFVKKIHVSCRFCRLSQFQSQLFVVFSLQIHPETGSLLAGSRWRATGPRLRGVSSWWPPAAGTSGNDGGI